MMRQYLEAKSQHPDAIVLFRMGDFYETFMDDAVEAARILELTLTSRNKKDDEPIPMAGVPHHALWTYVPRLLEAGRCVAVCEQVEDPRTAKGIVRREVVRVITPGVVLDESGLDGPRNNFLAAVSVSATGDAVGIAWTDASTAERRGTVARDLERALDELGRIDPREVLVDAAAAPLVERLRSSLRGAVISPFAAPAAPGTDPLTAAEGLINAYLKHTGMASRLPTRPLERRDLAATVRLGPETVSNLELLRTLADGHRRGALLHVIDHTRTPMGSRALKQWLLYPLTDPAAMRRRHDAVEAFVLDPILRATARESLEGVYDLERLTTRIAAGSATPRDLVALASSLERLPALSAALVSAENPALTELSARLDPVPEVGALLSRAVADEPPVSLKDGGVFREGYHAELDELISISRDGKAWFNRYADGLRAESGIQSLKIRYNGVFGYFIEVTRANLHMVPDTWLRKQTLANAERYYTAELKEREEKVLGAHDRRIALETELFDALRAELASFGDRVRATAEIVGSIDVLAGLAELAQRRGYVRPEVDESGVLEIIEGRHPVIETIVGAGEFVPNDTHLDAAGQQILVITGPNMAGKSTVMRQVALIVILAQMGSFVPAARARIGVVDQVFTRVGASDNLARGQSTFMVEMTETASILGSATDRSLVILDEIGRGTSTYDGVSIAWAVAEDLHDRIGARTLFATHYHELTELASTRPRIANMTIAVKRWRDEIVFLRRLVPGGTNRSYGIQVARLAGLPEAVVSRAREVLKLLEEHAVDRDGRPHLARTAGHAPAAPTGGWQLNLFAAPAPPAPSPALLRLAELDPDALSPRQALDLLFELRALLDDDAPPA
ncbi:MAG: DNA mismatch repair protein MutS [Myxococcota bacterium]